MITKEKLEIYREYDGIEGLIAEQRPHFFDGLTVEEVDALEKLVFDANIIKTGRAAQSFKDEFEVLLSEVCDNEVTMQMVREGTT